MLLELSPFIFEIGGFGIRWYSLLLAVSIAVGLYYFIRNGVKHGIDEDSLYNIALISIIGGMIGARIIYVATNLGAYAGDLLEIIRVDHGGLSWHGALLGGVLAAWAYAARKKIDLKMIMDLAVPGLALGYALVRVGNIFNQEVLGRPTGFGLERHPAQLYGTAIGVGLLILHYILSRRPRPSGYLFWTFFIYNTVFRALIEDSVREEHAVFFSLYINDYLGVGLLTLVQLLAIPLIVFGFWMRRRAVQSSKPSAT
ncbi:MAG: prolipoprotein diacylglyceryl transferase [Firmicutes bacterium]|nr:prolipoprotein diacylglyceryl transferase [Bacillota bacterium]